MVVEHADGAWNLIPLEDERLIRKAGSFRRGEKVQVFGRVACTETGFVLRVDGVMRDP
ncbi:MAG: hypothetical protein MUC63_02025 [Planctomycetes bacterium]|nr:hypothetical protein [Planctomycetota bacterium]